MQHQQDYADETQPFGYNNAVRADFSQPQYHSPVPAGYSPPVQQGYRSPGPAINAQKNGYSPSPGAYPSPGMQAQSSPLRQFESSQSNLAQFNPDEQHMQNQDRQLQYQQMQYQQGPNQQMQYQQGQYQQPQQPQQITFQQMQYQQGQGQEMQSQRTPQQQPYSQSQFQQPGYGANYQQGDFRQGQYPGDSNQQRQNQPEYYSQGPPQPGYDASESQRQAQQPSKPQRLYKVDSREPQANLGDHQLRHQESDTQIQQSKKPSAESFPSSSHPLRKALNKVLATAERAVSEDNAMRYSDALASYRETIIGIDRILSRVDILLAGQELTRAQLGLRAPGADDDEVLLIQPSRSAAHQLGGMKKKLIDIRNSYIQRVDVLLDHMPVESAAMYNTPPGGLPSDPKALPTPPALENAAMSPKRTPAGQKTSAPGSTVPQAVEAILKEDPALLLDSSPIVPTSATPDPLPTKPEFRTFWLMRQIMRSMSTGAFITPRLYVPRAVWYLPGAKLAAYDAKLHAIDEAARMLGRFKTAHDQVLGQLLGWLASAQQQQRYHAQYHPNTSGPLLLPPPIGFDLTPVVRDLAEMDMQLESLRTGLSRKLKFLETQGSQADAQGGAPTPTPVTTSAVFTHYREGQVPSSPSQQSLASPSSLNTGNLSPSIAPSVMTTSTGSTAVNSLNPGDKGSNTRLQSWGSRLSKSVEKLTRVQSIIIPSTKGERVEDPSGLIEALGRVFRSAHVVEQWMEYFEGVLNLIEASGGTEMVTRTWMNQGVSDVMVQTWSNQALAGSARCKKVAGFFMGCICAFVIKDLEMLWDRHAKRTKNALLG
ncbi:hypothetical protein BJ742DRAFT_814182 [Cladochytrium replicatum]|nr:hypothetical protein BJ742DRAFT_814182 [Cladochytrium replicatum]